MRRFLGYAIFILLGILFCLGLIVVFGWQYFFIALAIALAFVGGILLAIWLITS